MRRFFIVFAMLAPIAVWACSSPGDTVIINQQPPSGTPDSSTPRDAASTDATDAGEDDAADAADAAEDAPVCARDLTIGCGATLLKGYRCPAGATPAAGCTAAPANDAGQLIVGEYCCP